MLPRLKIQILLVAIVAGFAGLTGAFFGERAAYAQGVDNDYLDVGLILEVPNISDPTALNHNLSIAVANHGSRTAYDVEVVVNIVYPEDSSHFKQAPAVPIGNAYLESDERTLRWYIPSLRGLQRVEVIADVTHRNTSALAGDLFDYRSYPHEHFGKVTTASYESDIHKGNNTARVWSYRGATAHNHYNQAAGNYSVAVSVDDPSPSPGDTVEFTIKTTRADPYPTISGLTPPPIDLKVEIRLTEGLSVDVDPNATPPA